MSTFGKGWEKLISQPLSLTTFYRWAIEILNSYITVWFGNCTVAEIVFRVSLPCITDNLHHMLHTQSTHTP